MPRSNKKGPYVNEKLVKKIQGMEEEAKEQGEGQAPKTMTDGGKQNQNRQIGIKRGW